MSKKAKKQLRARRFQSVQTPKNFTEQHPEEQTEGWMTRFNLFLSRCWMKTTETSQKMAKKSQKMTKNGLILAKIQLIKAKIRLIKAKNMAQNWCVKARQKGQDLVTKAVQSSANLAVQTTKNTMEFLHHNADKIAVLMVIGLMSTMLAMYSLVVVLPIAIATGLNPMWVVLGITMIPLALQSKTSPYRIYEVRKEQKPLAITA